MQVVIVGAGAVGLALGSCLLQSGDAVSFVVRDPRTRAALRDEGLTRSGLFGEAQHCAADFEILESETELRGREPDCILVCTKSTASPAVARALGSVWADLGSAPAVVLCQNGWGNAEIFASSLPAERVFSARVITGFRRRAPSRVEITVHAAPIRIGSLFGSGGEPRIDVLCRHISAWGPPCESSPDISKDLLAKLLYNCALNPLGAILGVPYGALGEREETRALIQALLREVFDAIGRAGLSTHWQSADDYLDDFYTLLLPPTQRHESSMLQDLRAGRDTEIDSLSGAVVELAEQHGGAAPVNAALRELVHAIERKRPNVP